MPVSRSSHDLLASLGSAGKVGLPRKDLANSRQIEASRSCWLVKVLSCNGCTSKKLVSMSSSDSCSSLLSWTAAPSCKDGCACGQAPHACVAAKLAQNEKRRFLLPRGGRLAWLPLPSALSSCELKPVPGVAISIHFLQCQYSFRRYPCLLSCLRFQTIRNSGLLLLKEHASASSHPHTHTFMQPWKRQRIILNLKDQTETHERAQ